jgi:hypothetical protein
VAPEADACFGDNWASICGGGCGRSGAIRSAQVRRATPFTGLRTPSGALAGTPGSAGFVGGLHTVAIVVAALFASAAVASLAAIPRQRT